LNLRRCAVAALGPHGNLRDLVDAVVRPLLIQRPRPIGQVELRELFPVARGIELPMVQSAVHAKRLALMLGFCNRKGTRRAAEALLSQGRMNSQQAIALFSVVLHAPTAGASQSICRRPIIVEPQWFLGTFIIG
jgi:hypothetical protein